MQNLQKDLIELLKKEDNLTIEGELNKPKIIELALQLDTKLLSLLLSNDKFKKHFFKEVDNIFVFDKIKFQRFVSNKSFLPDSYTAFKNRIGLTINDDSVDNYISNNKDVVLAWPHKDCVLEGGQTKEDQKRDEVFWNETLAPDSIDRLLDPKVFTNFKKYEGVKNDNDVFEVKEKNVKADKLDITKENLILKGNNLLALSSLLKTHRNKVKLIYLDPPYNTGGDSFAYNDNFIHSSWLVFMKNRLEVAKELLKTDGLMFIQCDYNEDAYLKVLMDEIFGNQFYITTITVKSNSISGNKTQHKDKTILKNKDSILVYKNKTQITIKPQYSEKKEWDTHYNSILVEDELGNYTIRRLKDVLIEEGIIKENYTINKNSINENDFYDFIFNNKDKIFRRVNSIPQDLKSLSLENENQVVGIEKDGNKMFAYNGGRLSFLSSVFKEIEGQQKMAQLLGDLWTDIDFQNTQNEGGISLTNGKKPEELLMRIIDMTTNEGDIILDFYFGSGTTGAVAHKMKRQFIGIEQLDYGDNNSTIRLKNVINGDKSGISNIVNWKGGGSFIYAKLMEHNQKYINQIHEAVTKEDLIDIWHKMEDKAFLSYQFDKSIFNQRLEAFKTASLDDMKKYLIEILDKNQLYVNLSEIDDKSNNVNEKDKELNKSFYKI